MDFNETTTLSYFNDDQSGEEEILESNQGLLHLWFGYNNISTKSFSSFIKGLSVHKVSIGQKHCAILTTQGYVYTYGNNQYGQLGCGNNQDTFDEPVLVKAFNDVTVVDISCGVRHTAAVTSSGNVYCWGDSTKGQCANSNQFMQNTDPVKVTILSDGKTGNQLWDISNKGKSCSKSGTKLQRNSRTLSLGGLDDQVKCNEFTGKINRQNTLEEQKVEFNGKISSNLKENTSEEVKIVQISCGGNHTMALSEHGELWAWGTGLPLGLNLSDNNQVVLLPQRIDFLIGRKVLQVSSGANHTLALVQKLPLLGHYHQQTRNSIQSNTSRKGQGRSSLVNVEVSSEPSKDQICDKCHSPVHKAKFNIDGTHHVCPLGLEVTSNNAKLIALRGTKAVDSQSLDTDSTCSDVDQTGGSMFLTAENSPQIERINFVENVTGSEIEGPKQDKVVEIKDICVLDESTIPMSVPKDNSHQESSVHFVVTCDKNTSMQITNNSSVETIKNSEKIQENSLNSDINGERLEVAVDGVVLQELDKQKDLDIYNTTCSEDKSDNANIIDKEMQSSCVHVDASQEEQNNTEHSNNNRVKQEILESRNQSDPIINPSKSESNSTAKIPTDGKLKLLISRNSSDSIGSMSKSKSTFLDEEEAKEFLERQLSGEDGVHDTENLGEMSPLVKKMENILQYVPNTSTAIAMQEYVTSWTKNVVTNIKSSVETTMDRFGIVQSLGSSMDEEDVKVEATFGEDDKNNETAKLEKLKDFQRFGTLPKSTSLGGDKMRLNGRSHKRKGSLPTGVILSDITPVMFRCDDIVVDTEVWSWGQGQLGQLGHGDKLNRSQPCKLKFFSDKKVAKISSGGNHNVVVTADCQLYSWGCNDTGQLGHDNTSLITSPHKVKVGADYPVFDISAGDHHSVVLVDGPENRAQVYFTGKQPGKTEGKEDSVTKYTHINNLHKVGLIGSIYAGGELCACISDKADGNCITLLHEFAITERQFGTQLHFVEENILKPLLASDSFLSKDSSQLGMALGLLCDAFMCITDMISVNHLEMSQVVIGTRPVSKLQLLCRPDQCIGVYQHYCKCFTDVLAIGGFKTCAQLCSSILDKCKDQILTLLEQKVYNTKDLGTTLLKVMKVPFNRLKDYSKVLGRLVLKFPSYTSEKQILEESNQLWEGFRQTSTLNINQAETTNNFWCECSHKLTEALKTPTRRVLFDSKVHPINFHGGGRFSSHRFILFNDIFAHIQGSYHSTYPLQTIWLQTSSTEQQVPGNFMRLQMPEDVVTLTAPSATAKSEWVWALNQGIDRALCQQRHNVEHRSGVSTLSPPRDRHASYVFTKHPNYRDAKYEGMWRTGLVYGQGELQWPDGRKFIGSFKNGYQDGYGIYTVPRENGEKEVYEGMWRNGQLSGYGYIKYLNGDSYEGYFRDGRRHGHGTLQQGKLTSSLASIYIGEWCMDKKSGYGVYEDVTKGQKYMGLWLDDHKHGNGVIVTIDGMYFEGTFQQNKMTGYGLLMTEDNSCYEGEFCGGPNLAGKGTLTLPNGDYIDGSFSGSFNEGIKVNGTFYKSTEGTTIQHGFSHALGIVPKSYGKLSVPAQRKWEEVFDHCCGMLGVTKDCTHMDPLKAWEKCAAFIEIGKKMSISSKSKSSRVRSKLTSHIPEILEKIPEYSRGRLTVEYYATIKEYVAKAFECPYHPLGKLLENLVDVYRATYIGVGAHPRLLQHAVLEVQSFIDRMYPIVRILFSDLPDGFSLVQIFRENVDQNVDFEESGEDISEVVTPGSLLYPLLLPKIYPPLFTLYALYNEKADEQYWRRIASWNKQSDLALMSYLGVDQKFWTFEEHSIESPQKLSKIRDKCYIDAIETLQGLSTSFSPADKLYLIQATFNAINKAVHDRLGQSHLWCMDDLFPVFQYVVVRSRIQHLGAEIHFMDDLMEPHLEHGELGLMFTTLKASYYQIQNEKIA